MDAEWFTHDPSFQSLWGLAILSFRRGNSPTCGRIQKTVLNPLTLCSDGRGAVHPWHDHLVLGRGAGRRVVLPRHDIHHALEGFRTLFCTH
ncbi:hypothetical protein TNCT_733631 [Trichonephila clavata]|uniref:Uncharacterized protein n=1 Tax=Trichonephila clavata TaxID=2740835 RepID=A0A8X6H473_TRICU|nr:hypothetical protein TNCT_733631 [Trichonephila clavata]